MARKRVWIVAPFTTLPGEPGFNRFTYLAEKMSDRMDVTLWTSRFSHHLKKVRDEWRGCETKYQIRLVEEPGYQRNVSISRLASHLILTRNMRKALKERAELRPDLIYIALPTIGASSVAVKLAEQWAIPSVVDIQDVWPEAFLVVPWVPQKAFSLLTWPLRRNVDHTLSHATAVVAVSNTFLRRARRVRAKGLTCHYIGTDIGFFDEQVKLPASTELPERRAESIWIVYIGTLSVSYDISTLITAFGIVTKEIPGLELLILGDGPERATLEKKAKAVASNIRFLGFKSYPEMCRILAQCDIGVNCISPKSKTSLPNKVFDYFAAGLPVINSVRGELQEMLDKNNAGVFYSGGDAASLSHAIRRLCRSKQECVAMGISSRKIAETAGNRQKSYDDLVRMVEDLMITSEG